MDHNQDRLAAFRENRARTTILSKEVQHLQEEKSKQVSPVPSLALGWRPLPCPCGIIHPLSFRPLSQG